MTRLHPSARYLAMRRAEARFTVKMLLSIAAIEAGLVALLWWSI